MISERVIRRSPTSNISRSTGSRSTSASSATWRQTRATQRSSRAIVSLGHSLDLEIVAEGVETVQQATLLRAEGCDEVQGFYYAGAMQADELIAYVRDIRARARSA